MTSTKTNAYASKLVTITGTKRGDLKLGMALHHVRATVAGDDYRLDLSNPKGRVMGDLLVVQRNDGHWVRCEANHAAMDIGGKMSLPGSITAAVDTWLATLSA